ncbi:MAG: lysophospholipid acyltransferase family protein [Deltaproteobacteria bacterium]|nr:lysophospholipid acyltransferase family protein [Deltaproteobacteria bacterium]
MKGLFYKTLIFVSKTLGLWVFSLFAWIVSTGYFFLFPRRVGAGIRFYKALFPDKGWHYHYWYTWKQYHNFTDLFVDRMLLTRFNTISFRSTGLEHLVEAARNGTGGVILMSHMGSWEVAALLLKKELPDINLLLYMGTKNKEQIETMQKEGVAQAGIRVIALDKDGGSPFDIVEGIKFLKGGDFVSMTGDTIWNRDQRSVPVRFLGHEAHLPETPHLFALLSGAPVFIFFSYRISRRTYHFSITKPIYVKAALRTERKEAVRKSAQEYAEILEQSVRNHPFQWYHFEPFLGKKID